MEGLFGASRICLPEVQSLQRREAREGGGEGGGAGVANLVMAAWGRWNKGGLVVELVWLREGMMVLTTNIKLSVDLNRSKFEGEGGRSDGVFAVARVAGGGDRRVRARVRVWYVSRYI